MKTFNFYTKTLLAVILLFACNQKEESFQVAEGETMGTYYRVTYKDKKARDFQSTLDSMLVAINNEISTYIPGSTISRFNKADEDFDLGLTAAEFKSFTLNPASVDYPGNAHFYTNLMAAQKAYEVTKGAFDATVMPLVNYWGFGYTPQKGVDKVDSVIVDSLRQLVGFNKLLIIKDSGNIILKKSVPGLQLDFGGTGQGYAIDALGIWLEQQGIKDYLVDIGGECRARGKNPKGKLWTIGVNTPLPEAKLTEYDQIVLLDDISLSTSGNYRKFHEINGVKYSHFIDPRTGFPKPGTLLSVSLFAKDCLTPDALATGCMVMGLEKSFEMIKTMEGVEGLFIYSDVKGVLQTKYTPGVEKMLKPIN